MTGKWRRHQVSLPPNTRPQERYSSGRGKPWNFSCWHFSDLSPCLLLRRCWGTSGHQTRSECPDLLGHTHTLGTSASAHPHAASHSRMCAGTGAVTRIASRSCGLTHLHVFPFSPRPGAVRELRRARQGTARGARGHGRPRLLPMPQDVLIAFDRFVDAANTRGLVASAISISSERLRHGAHPLDEKLRERAERPILQGYDRDWHAGLG
jgi:hypothetical protein